MTEEERLAEQLRIERALAAGGLAAAVRLILERMDRFQRALDTMQGNQGNLIRSTRYTASAVGQMVAGKLDEAMRYAVDAEAQVASAEENGERGG